MVPGALLVAIAMGLGSMDVPLARTVALVGTTWRFERPVRPGDTVRCRWRLNRKRAVEEPAWGLCGFAVEMENQRSEVVASGDVVRLLERRPVVGAEPAPVAAPPEGEVARTGRRRRRRRAANGDSPSVQPLVAAELLAAQPSPEQQPFVESLPSLEATGEGMSVAGTAPGESPPRNESAGAATGAVAASAPEQGDGGSSPARRRRRRGGRGRGGREPVGPELLALQAVDEEAPTPGAATAAMAGAGPAVSHSARTIVPTPPFRGEQVAPPEPAGAPVASVISPPPPEDARPGSSIPSAPTPPAASGATRESAPAVTASLPAPPTPFSQEPTELDPNRFAPLNAPSAQSPAASAPAEVAAGDEPARRPRRPRGPRRPAGGSTGGPETPGPRASSEGLAPAGAEAGHLSGSSAAPSAPTRARRPRRSRPPSAAIAGQSAASGGGASEAPSAGGS